MFGHGYRVFKSDQSEERKTYKDLERKKMLKLNMNRGHVFRPNTMTKYDLYSRPSYRVG